MPNFKLFGLPFLSNAGLTNPKTIFLIYSLIVKVRKKSTEPLVLIFIYLLHLCSIKMFLTPKQKQNDYQ